MKTLAALNTQVAEWKGLYEQSDSACELLDLAIIDGDREMLTGILGESEDIRTKLGELEFQLTLSGKYDQRDAILALHAGAGGVDSQDWASMLMRMYIRWS